MLILRMKTLRSGGIFQQRRGTMSFEWTFHRRDREKILHASMRCLSVDTRNNPGRVGRPVINTRQRCTRNHGLRNVSSAPKYLFPSVGRNPSGRTIPKASGPCRASQRDSISEPDRQPISTARRLEAVQLELEVRVGVLVEVAMLNESVSLSTARSSPHSLPVLCGLDTTPFASVSWHWDLSGRDGAWKPKTSSEYHGRPASTAWQIVTMRMQPPMASSRSHMT